jgi:hypothetical protein
VRSELPMKEWFRRLVRRADPAAERANVPAHPPRPDEAQTYSSDQPITSKEHDRFGRWPFAERIADTIATRTDPSSLVISLFGVWGDGKTSTLRMMEQALCRHSHVVVVNFNPWHFGSEQQLLKGFFYTLSDALGRSLSTRKEAIGEALKKYGSVLSIASVSVPGVQLGVGDAATGLGEALSSVELDDLRGRVEGFLKESGTRVVVLIDDIDRLDRTEIHAIFKLVKLSASFEHTSYVLAFDDSMVAAALGEKYGEGGRAAGRSFLEKIVQVPLHLPPADVIELRKLTFDGVDAALSLSGVALSEDQVQAFVRHFVDGIEPQLQTPRQAKLYGNALAFALPLLKGEAHPVDLMLIEGIRVFYPKLYGVIRDNPELFLKAADENVRRDQHRQRISKLIDDSLDDSGVIDKERVRSRLVEVLFPRIGNMGYGHEWDMTWSKEQRIRSVEYFQRFFTYSVPPGDVGDLYVEGFLDEIMAAQTTSESIDAKLKALAERRGMPRFITKLRYRDETLPAPVARALATALSRNGMLLPREESIYSIGGTWTQGAILVSQLSKLVPFGAERDAFIVDILRAASPLPFAAECFRWIRRSSDETDDQHIVSEGGEAIAKRTVADRIHGEASHAPIYRTFGQDAPHLFWIWSSARGRDEVTGFIRQWLDVSAEEVDSFLDVRVGKAWGLESGLSHRSDFRREAYNAIAELIDASVVLEKLRARHGAQLDNPQFRHNRDVPLATRIAHQFAFIHQAVLEEQRQARERGNARAADGSADVQDAAG